MGVPLRCSVSGGTGVEGLGRETQSPRVGEGDPIRERRSYRVGRLLRESGGSGRETTTTPRSHLPPFLSSNRSTGHPR